jgi:hypothetical protein
MTTIYADFNALTEDRSICLSTRGSSEDIKKFGIQPGDRVRLSDGELQVEALWPKILAMGSSASLRGKR